MTPVQKALALAEKGLYVFPTLTESITLSIGGEDREYPVKSPDPRIVPRGVLDATRDPGVIEDWWRDRPENAAGVATGLSHIVALDIDRKNGVDGQDVLEREWLEVPPTFSYETPNNGIHRIYLAPENVNLNGKAKYRKMDGIDRRGGNSYVVWYGPVPTDEDHFAPAPEWLCDPAEARSSVEFTGTVQDWYANLTAGEPNALTRKALGRIKPDMSHSEMVESQFEAVKLGSEGNPGVIQLLDAIETAWLDRPTENHSTPRNEWEQKFQEALISGVEKYGAKSDHLSRMPPYNMNMAGRLPDRFVFGPAVEKQDWTLALASLVEQFDDDDYVASILWNAPPLVPLSHEWGLDFVHERIAKARTRPEPTRENPALERIEKKAEAVSIEAHSELLTEDERQVLLDHPTFVDVYCHQAALGGFSNEKYARATAWTVASLAFAFRGFIPVTPTDKMGLNLWSNVLGYSGTGKSRNLHFRDAVLNAYFAMDEGEQQYNLGAESSPEGLNVGLLQRDKKASFFAQDEGSGFFKKLAAKDWMSGLDDTLSRWYEGRVDPSSKLSLKDLRGKSALTSFHIQFFATPDRLTQVLTREMFLSGFLARFFWVVGDPPVKTDARFNLLQQTEAVVEDFDAVPAPVRDLVADLTHAASLFPTPTPIIATDEALLRMSQAYKTMHALAEGRDHWDIVEPSVTRLMETMRKCAAITAMYRGSATIEMPDAIVAIGAVEEWFENLFVVADMISAGAFQRDVDMMEAWVRARGGRATKAAILDKFRNIIVRDPRELDVRLAFLVESGRFNREEAPTGVAFRVNGG